MLKLKQPDPDEVVERANDVHAPLIPAHDDAGLRPLTEEEKENFTGSWRCPKCGLPMFLACIEPAVEVDYERRTFECSTCAYGETITVNFRIDRGDPCSGKGQAMDRPALTTAFLRP